MEGSRSIVPASARERLFELAIDLLGVAGFDGRFCHVNPACERLLGWSVEEFQQRPFMDFVHPDDVAATISEMQSLSEGEATIQFENRYRCKDGSYRWLLWNATPDTSQQLIYAVAHDVTPRKLAEIERDQYEDELRAANDQLERADELKRQFLAMASHELRTPLAAISGFTSTMLSLGDRLTADQHHEFLTIIDRQAARLSRLVDDLLTLSRIEAGKVEARPVRLDVSLAIKQALLAQGMSDVDLSCPPSMSAYVDPDHLDQIVTNFLTNARKYGKPPIQVRVVRGDAGIEIRVCDNGSGVPEGDVAHLFERFARSRMHVEAEIPGTGLGLSIVRGLAQAQGGDAWYEPNEPRGARFALRLPTRPERATPRRGSD